MGRAATATAWMMVVMVCISLSSSSSSSSSAYSLIMWWIGGGIGRDQQQDPEDRTHGGHYGKAIKDTDQFEFGRIQHNRDSADDQYHETHQSQHGDGIRIVIVVGMTGTITTEPVSYTHLTLPTKDCV